MLLISITFDAANSFLTHLLPVGLSTLCCKLRFVALSTSGIVYFVLQNPFRHTYYQWDCLLCAANSVSTHLLPVGEPSLCCKLRFDALTTSGRAFFVLQTPFCRTFYQWDCLLCAAKSVSTHLLPVGLSTLCCKLRFDALTTSGRAFFVLQTPFRRTYYQWESLLCAAYSVSTHFLPVGGPSLCCKLHFVALSTNGRAFFVLQTPFRRTYYQWDRLLCAANSVSTHLLPVG